MGIEVGLRDMNQQFSEYIQMVEKGEEIIVTRRGAPIAKLVPFKAESTLSEKQKAAKKRTLVRMKKGFKYSDKKFKRDDIYDR